MRAGAAVRDDALKSGTRRPRRQPGAGKVAMGMAGEASGTVLRGPCDRRGLSHFSQRMPLPLGLRATAHEAFREPFSQIRRDV